MRIPEQVITENPEIPWRDMSDMRNIAVHEYFGVSNKILMVEEKIQDLILRRSPAHEIKKTAVESGNFTTLKENAVKKALQGITTLEEVASVVMD